MTVTAYSVPKEAQEAFEKLLNDPRLAIPDAVKTAAKNVSYQGSDLPFLPIPFKFTEGISAVKGLEAAFASAIARNRYDVDTGKAVINTDHAALFVFSAFTTTINGKSPRERHDVVVNRDIYHNLSYPYRRMASNVYKTKDGRFFHLHGSMNSKPSQTMVGVDLSRDDIVDTKEIQKVYGEAVAKWDAVDLDKAANDEYKQAGTICYSHDEFKQTEQGKAVMDCPIYELTSAAAGSPIAWPPAPAGPKKALSGIKVLELTRIIAGPAIGKGLAEHGATVLRITSDKLPDMDFLHPDLQQGKYQGNLDLKSAEGKAKLQELIKDADVFIDGYRPGCIARLGFDHAAVRAINPNTVYVRENCYGWHGPWVGRSGWQQISDCFVGLSEGFGAKLGLEKGEAVVPIFPNSDFGAGCSGLVAVMHALLLRATKGGAYNVDASLTYYNLLLMSLGYYPDDVWAKLKPAAPIRHDWDMSMMLGATIPVMFQNNPGIFTSKEFWHTIDSPRFGGTVRTVSPVVQFEKGLGVSMDRAPVQNGDDPAEWPQVA